MHTNFLPKNCRCLKNGNFCQMWDIDFVNFVINETLKLWMRFSKWEFSDIRIFPSLKWNFFRMILNHCDECTKVTNDSLHWRYWLCVKAAIRFGNHETPWFLGKCLQSQKELRGLDDDAAMCNVASFEFKLWKVWLKLALEHKRSQGVHYPKIQ